MAVTNNVASLNRGTVFEDIQTFLRKLELNSEGTAKKYEVGIRRFFSYMRNKDIENLVEADLIFRNADVLKYQLYLKEIPLANSTINGNIFAINSLYNFLEKNEYNVKAKTMEVDSLPDSSENYGQLSIQQAEKMAELVKTQVKGIEKSALIKLAYKTSIREGALLNLTWSDIKKAEDKDFYIVETIDKGNKKDRKPISSVMYNELLEINKQKYYLRYEDEKIFHIQTNTISDMMKVLRNEMGLDDNVKFHSLKNVAINWTYENEGIVAAARQGNHSSIQTTYNHYIKKDNNFESMFGVAGEDDIDNTIVDELTHEELLKLVKAKTNGVWMQIKRDAKKIIEER